MKTLNPRVDRLSKNGGWSPEDVVRIKRILREFSQSPSTNNLTVAGFGEGKSSAYGVGMEEGDTFATKNTEQLNQKISQFQSIKNALNQEFKPQWIVGKLRFLGYKNRSLEPAENTPNEAYIWDKDDEKVVKKDLASLRNSKSTRKILQDLQNTNYSISTIWRYHSSKKICKAYSNTLKPEVYNSVHNFSTIHMLGLTKEISNGSLGLDEGVDGKRMSGSMFNLPSWRQTQSKIRKNQVLGNVGSRRVNPWNTTVKNIKQRYKQPSYENDITSKKFPLICQELDILSTLLYLVLQNKEKDITDYETKGTNFWKSAEVVFLRSEDIPKHLDSMSKHSKSEWNNSISNLIRLMNSLEQPHSHKDVPIIWMERTSQPNLGDTKKVVEIWRLAEWFRSFHNRNVEVEAYRNVASVNHDGVAWVKKAGKMWKEVLDWDDDVFILDATADRNQAKIMAERTNQDIEILSEDRSLDKIDQQDLKTDYHQYGYGSNNTWGNNNLSGKKFKKVIIPLINKLADYKRVGVISKKKNKSGEVIPDLFSEKVVSGHFTEEEGSNRFRECEVLFVIGSPRPKATKIWKQVYDHYGEKMGESPKYLGELVKTNNQGSQIGYHDPEELWADFSWSEDYDFNPLQQVWENQISKTVLEKYFRKRNQEDESSLILRLGIDVMDFIQDKENRDESDLTYFLIDFLTEQNDLDELDVSKFLTGLDKPDFINKNSPPEVKYLLDTVIISGNSRKLKLNRRKLVSYQVADQDKEWVKIDDEFLNGLPIPSVRTIQDWREEELNDVNLVRKTKRGPKGGTFLKFSVD